jgi:hypothetical protein
MEESGPFDRGNQSLSRLRTFSLFGRFRKIRNNRRIGTNALHESIFPLYYSDDKGRNQHDAQSWSDRLRISYAGGM